MPRSLPPPSWLRTFEAAARHTSFTRAAEELHVTQSAVSQQIRLLEDRLGQVLFHRLPQSLQLTDSGRAYLAVVHDAFERLTLGTEELFGYARGELVTIRATPGFGELWLVPRLGSFYREHPDLDIRVISTIWNPQFIESGVDLEIRYGIGEWTELEMQPLMQEYLLPVCAATVSARLEGVPARLADERLLHTDGFRNGWPEWLQRAGAARDVDGGRGSHFDTAGLPIKLAEQGLGVAMGRWSMIERHIDSGRLVAPFDLAMPVEETFYVAWPAGGQLRPEAALLRDWLLRVARGAEE
ncbi:LysR substrate-binding domain-containing protein [Aquisalimonas lutea]|uniref:LysR substrate-binding domain-containing protein n=1 Tax=Aquisalimonas lutea TaxID=1327750 RepID=UPI0025B47392|nr:LysR substrate-binding domain-containing protein [Aquisalimonas lutea]MDN3518495.1 LysR substrate-binding domain-containing protein [Aquisalimonas lutea]